MPKLSTVHLPTDSAGQFYGPCPPKVKSVGHIGQFIVQRMSKSSFHIKSNQGTTQQISLGFNIYTNPRLLFSFSSINRSNFSRKKHTSKRPDNGFQIKDRQSPHWRWSQPRVRISVDFVSEKIGESN